MPYSYPEDVPTYVKNLPAEAQRICVEAFNVSFDRDGDEEASRMACWGAVKQKFEPDAQGEWIQKTAENVDPNVNMRYVADGILLSDGMPVISEIQILRTGTFHHPVYGKFTITDGILQEMAKNFGTVRPKPPTELVVDYEHLSTVDHVNSEQGKAAGWFRALKAAPGKLFATIEWTAEAAKSIREKLFRFFSPEFTLDYTDKETGKKAGPVILSGALTNRPFLEGMEPVVLSEGLGRMIFSEEVKVKMAEWDTQYINDLPDPCFAYIRPGGEKDENGKTVPRNLRFLPYRDAQEKVDLPHLRNALARLTQSDLNPQEQAAARKTLVSAARTAGVGEYRDLLTEEELQKKEVTVDEAKIRQSLGLDDKGDIAQAIETLKATVAGQEIALADSQTKLAAEKQRADDNKAKLTEYEVTKTVTEALVKGKITPKMREWAAAYVMKDPDGFKKFVETSERVGPDLSIKGQEHVEGAGDIQLSELEKKIAKNLGVPEAKLLEAKVAEAARGK